MKFYELPPTGMDVIERDGDLLELLQSIPYLMMGRRLPPLSVLNSILETGLADAGMSGGVRWDPFTIDDEQYKQLSVRCRKVDLATPTYPDWVRSRSDFQVWEAEVDRGVPAESHKRLTDRLDEATAALERAMKGGAPELEIADLHLKVIEAGKELADLLNEEMDM